MRGVRFTKAELAHLRAALETKGYTSEAEKRARDGVLAKLDAAEEPAGVDVAPLQDALVRAALGKVVPLEGGFARASRQAKSVGATPELATLVGGWMARQTWLHGPMTLIDVLNKWHQWLPKARATEPPALLTPGLDAQTGPDATPARRATPRGRQKAGLR